MRPSISTERNNNNNTITRTTVYDTKTGGFITSVTTESSSDSDQPPSDLEEEDVDEDGDYEVEKDDPAQLILTQDTYNTLGKGGKKTVSFVTSKEDTRKKMLDDALQSCESKLMLIISF